MGDIENINEPNAAYGKGDGEKCVSMYDENTVFTPPNRPLIENAVSNQATDKQSWSGLAVDRRSFWS